MTNFSQKSFVRYIYLFLVLVLSGCATSLKPQALPEATTKFYFGEVIMSSPDGKIPYGKSVSLIKRTVDPANNTISEIVLQPPRDPKQKPKDINTILKRVESSNVFSAADDEKKFEGKLTFTGSEWSWNNWTYDIKLADGSKLDGVGVLDASGIKTQKTFYKPDGKASILIKEDVKLISSAEYDAQHKKMMGSP